MPVRKGARRSLSPSLLTGLADDQSLICNLRGGCGSSTNGRFFRARCWFSLSRPAFHSVGVLPFMLGTAMAWRLSGVFRLEVFLAGALGAVLIMLAAYLAGEHEDVAEDRISAGLPRSPFAGGSGMVVSGLVPARHVQLGVGVSLVLAGVVGLVLVFVWHTGPWTIPLGVLGMIGGFFYSSRPVRWVSVGLGEVWIAFCFGWLPVATGYYLQVGSFTSLVNAISLPLVFTIFNVILVNEFPDYAADSATGKRNLAVRLGLPRAAKLYAVIAGASWVSLLVPVLAGAPALYPLLQVPFVALSAVLVVRMAKGAWAVPARLERLCGGTILVDLGVAAATIAAFLAVGA